jgi:hypothetical protein
LFKLKSQLSGFGLLITGLVILTLFTTLGGLRHYQGELADQLSQPQTAGNAKQAVQKLPGVTGTTTPGQTLAGNNQQSIPTSTKRTSGGVAGKTIASSAVPANKVATASQSAAATSQSAIISVNLSVNGQAKGTVKLPGGSTQCDLLAQALTDGNISSLDMRYSSEYGTEAVYVIDGVGDPGSVWWTYTVNGHPPPYGCAYITAHSGDSVNWQYVKN